MGLSLWHSLTSTWVIFLLTDWRKKRKKKTKNETVFDLLLYGVVGGVCWRKCRNILKNDAQSCVAFALSITCGCRGRAWWIKLEGRVGGWWDSSLPSYQMSDVTRQINRDLISLVSRWTLVAVGRRCLCSRPVNSCVVCMRHQWVFFLPPSHTPTPPATDVCCVRRTEADRNRFEMGFSCLKPFTHLAGFENASQNNLFKGPACNI